MKSAISTLTYKIYFSAILCCSISLMSAQVKKAFEPRFSETVNGNVTMIANNMLSRHATNPYNGSSGNHDFNDNVFVDIDSDNSTFNSSNATFNNPEPTASCLVIKKAYLYWAAADKEEDDPSNEPNWNYNQVKLMLPGIGTYSTLTADNVIYRGRDDNGDGNTNDHFVNDPYICYKDITNQVQGLLSPFGIYQIANVRAKEGALTGHGGGTVGTSGGWEIVFIYENPTFPKKNITIFDGYAHVTSSVNNFEIEFNGFSTVPSGTVNTNIVLGGLEGDRDLDDDKLQIKNVANNWVDISTPNRPNDNFFNSKITKDGTDFIARNPASLNTLGFDAGVFTLDNTGNSIIANNQTSATIRMTSDQETYGLFLLGLAVDVWEPNVSPIVLQTNIGATTTVNENENITFSFDIENTGNDDAVNLVIETQIPDEVDFIAVNNLPTGVSYIYNAPTLTFTITDDSLTATNMPSFTLEFDLKVKDKCYFLETKCSNSFQMYLQATYNGVMNPKEVTVNSSSGTDSCGLGNSSPNVFTINQPALVNWSTAANALNSTIECDNIQGILDAQALIPELEDCNLDIIKTSGVFEESSTCPSNGTYTNTWIYTDICGRTSSVFTQIITVQDNSVPTLSTIAGSLDATLECDNISGIADAIALIPSATDTCTADPTLNLISDVTTADANCDNAYVRVRTWNFTDGCGSTSTDFVQTITVQDNSVPTLSTIAGSLDATLECDNISGIADAIALIPSATDTCTADPILNLISDITTADANCDNAYVRVRTWNFTDGCGSTSTDFVQTITVQDNSVPTLSTIAGSLDATLECDNISGITDAIALIPSATDTCTADPTLNLISDITTADANCDNAYVRVRTWNFTDGCGSTSTDFVQTITVQDNSVPTLSTIAGSLDATLECDNISGIADAIALIPSATDTCTADPTLNLISDVTTADANCDNAYVRVRTWNFTDGCGSTSTDFVQTITVQDNSVPTLSTIAGSLDATLECDNISGIADAIALIPSATDTCTADPILNLISDITTADANCDNAYVRVRTWNFTDGCGSTSTDFVQTITVQDNSVPTLSTIAGSLDATLECDNISGIADAIALIPSATDTCTADPTLNLISDVTTADANCDNAYVRVRTWNFTDGCGSTSTDFVQTITVQDNSVPTLSTIAGSLDATLECDNISGIADAIALIPSATDTCTADPILNLISDITTADANCDNAYVRVRTWNFTDGCGSTSTDFVQTITVQDNSVPTLSTIAGSLDATLECDNISGITDAIALIPSATDTCTADPTLNLISDITTADANCDNAYVRVRTWNFTDGCGSTSTDFVQTITVQDNSVPTLSTIAGSLDATLECDNISGIADAIALIPSATDTCTADPTLNLISDVTTADANCDNAYVRVRTWNFTDGCGSTSTDFVQTITVQDNSVPTLSTIAGSLDATLECDNISGIADAIALIPSATDTCTADPILNLISDITTADANCDNAYVRVRTWNFTDGCGSTSTDFVQTITVQDNSVPTLSTIAGSLDATLECDNISGIADAIALIPSATDTCTADPTLNLISDITTADANCDNAYVRVRTWNFMDGCGNTSTDFVQTITVQDNSVPTISTIAGSLDATLECDNISGITDAIALIPSATDTCTANPTLNLISDVTTTDANCDIAYVRVRTWNFTDGCGNTSTDFVQTITVQDTTDPSFIENLPSDTTVECDSIPDPSVLTANDNCDINLNVDYSQSQVADPNGCATEYVITRIWTVSDCAGNTISHTQTINVEDSSEPVLSGDLPQDTTVSCDNIPDSVSLTVEDNCGNDIPIQYNEVITGQDDQCATEYVITRTWNVTDCAGNTTSHVQVINVIDSDAPVFDISSLPADTTVECDDSIPALEDVIITATDNCADISDIVITPSEVITNQNDECSNTYTITRTWIATDCAENTTEHEQVINVIDSDAPVFDISSLPADTTVECDDVIPALEDVIITATDNCADISDIVITPSEVITNQNDECSNTYTITRTWIATDCAENTTEHEQVINVIDSDAPVFDISSLPADATVECDDVIPALEDVIITATDNCADISDIVITPSEVITNQNDECSNTYTITRTWIATDCAGNATEHVQVINVIDSDAPVFDISSLPADTTVECDDVIPALEDVVITATDNCADISDIVITPSEVITNQNDDCSNTYTITRTWIATDCAGNTTEHVQVINVIDSDAPVFDISSLPADATVECDSIPVAAVLTAIDNCESNVIVTFSENQVADPNGCATEYVITRIWTVSDCAGNTNSHTQTINVEDSSEPVLSGDLPQDTTVSCDNIPDSVSLTVEDNCGNDIPIQYNEVITGQDDQCATEYVITRTWNVTDCAGNTTSHVQVINVIDSDAPVFDISSLPADTTVECDDSIPALEDVIITATDNCADISDIVITPSEVITNQNDECSNTYTITRTWIATDCAENTTEHEQVINVIDSDAPVFDISSLPADTTVECDDVIPALEDVIITATDNCADISDIVITPSEVITNQNDECSNTYTITRTWIATDCAENTTEHEQVINVIDSDAPVFDISSLPADTTVECDDVIPALEDVIITATDNCADISDIVITPSEVITNQNDECSNTYTITRTWIATDCAGNTTEHEQVINVIDSDAPVFDISSLPADATVECDDVIPALEDVIITATDNCADISDIVITPSEVITNQNDECSNTYTITRTWIATDCAGNTTEHVQVINVIDSDAPVFDISSLPADATVECDDVIPALEDVVITATDNCANISDIVITPSEVITNQNDDCSNTYTITRTWIATDCAGNTTEHEQVINVIDSDAPVFDISSLPADTTVECDDSIPALEDVVITATDNCANISDIVITPSEVITNQNDECSNTYTITRTWIATDCAGNTTEHVQVINVIDSDAPVFDISSLPADATVECDDIIPALEDVVITATDNCADISDIVITPSEVITGQDSGCSNNYIITRTWTAIDCAGNATEHVQVINVVDDTPPVLTLGDDGSTECTGTDSSMNLEYIDWVSSYAGITATDNCGSVILTFIEGQWINDGCSDSIIVTFIATDECGLQGEVIERSFTISDTTAPEIIPEIEDVVFYCNDLPPVPVFAVIEGCSEANIEYNVTISGTEGATDYQIIRTWIITDDCGNETIKEQLLLVEPGCNCLEDMFISKAITPNGDIYNDYFKVEGIDDCGIPTLKMFNRWGALVYQSDDYDAKKGRWRGTAENGGTTLGGNNKLPTGTYYYIIEIRNSNVKAITGHVYLSTK